MRATLGRSNPGLIAEVVIDRVGGTSETLRLIQTGARYVLQSTAAPAEPHEFDAVLELAAGGRAEPLRFAMKEPAGRHH